MTDSTLSDLPNVDKSLFHIPAVNTVFAAKASTHPPRILLLYGSLRERSFSRLVVQESARILQAFGAETRIFNPTGLPLPDDAPVDHPKVQELLELMQWSEGQVWCSPERHGAMTGIMTSNEKISVAEERASWARAFNRFIGFWGFFSGLIFAPAGWPAGAKSDFARKRKCAFTSVLLVNYCSISQVLK